jgi:hypothetical protein
MYDYVHPYTYYRLGQGGGQTQSVVHTTADSLVEAAEAQRTLPRKQIKGTLKINT